MNLFKTKKMNNRNDKDEAPSASNDVVEDNDQSEGESQKVTKVEDSQEKQHHPNIIPNRRERLLTHKQPKPVFFASPIEGATTIGLPNNQKDTNNRNKNNFLCYTKSSGWKKKNDSFSTGDSNVINSINNGKYHSIFQDISSLNDAMDIVKDSFKQAWYNIKTNFNNEAYNTIYYNTENKENTKNKYARSSKIMERIKRNRSGEDEDLSFSIMASKQVDNTNLHLHSLHENHLLDYYNDEKSKLSSLYCNILSVNHQRSNSNKMNQYFFIITVRSVLFYSHPEFNDEDKLHSDLKLAYRRYTLYCSTEKKNEYLKLLYRLERLLIRLENIMASKEDENKEREDGNTSAKKTKNISLMKRLEEDVCKTSQNIIQYVDESNKVREDLWSKWLKLADLRKEQGYCTSLGNLSRGSTESIGDNATIDTSDDNDPNTGPNHNQSYSFFMNKLKLLYQWIVIINNNHHGNENKTNDKQKKAINNSNIPSESSLGKIMQKFEYFINNDDIIKTMNEEFTFNCNIKDMKHHLNLSSENAVQIERMRRKRISTEQYYIQLLINGKIVDTSNIVRLHFPSFNLAINHKFRVKMFRNVHPPDIVCIQLVKSRKSSSVVSSYSFHSKYMFFDEVISEIFINTCDKAPIINSNENDSRDFEHQLEMDWYQFCSSSNNIKDLKGFILIGSEWNTMESNKNEPTVETNVNNHSSSISDDEYHTKKASTKTNTSALIREKYYQKFQESFLPTDFLHLVQREMSLAFHLPGSNNISFLNHRVVQQAPMRHRLLRLRQYTNSIISFPLIPIPFSNIAIRDTKEFQSIFTHMKMKEDAKNEVN